MADWDAERLAESSAPHQLAIAAVLQLLPTVTGEPVLDLGCGEDWWHGRWPSRAPRSPASTSRNR
jgi:hypothetical protein